jgi:hypothetical protein
VCYSNHEASLLIVQHFLMRWRCALLRERGASASRACLQNPLTSLAFADTLSQGRRGASIII